MRRPSRAWRNKTSCITRDSISRLGSEGTRELGSELLCAPALLPYSLPPWFDADGEENPGSKWSDTGRNKNCRVAPRVADMRRKIAVIFFIKTSVVMDLDHATPPELDSRCVQALKLQPRASIETNPHFFDLLSDSPGLSTSSG